MNDKQKLTELVRGAMKRFPEEMKPSRYIERGYESSEQMNREDDHRHNQQNDSALRNYYT